MGCFDGPKKVTATSSERELANLARQKYQYSRGILDPLQARERAEGDRLASKTVQQRTVDHAVNTARENMPKLTVNPNRASTLKLSNNITSNTLARAGAAGEDVATKNLASKKLQNLSQGLQLSLSGSHGARSTAAADAGYQAAETQAKQYVNDARLNAAGNVVGTAGTVAAYKNGWFEPKPAPQLTTPGG